MKTLLGLTQVESIQRLICRGYLALPNSLPLPCHHSRRTGCPRGRLGVLPPGLIQVVATHGVAATQTMQSSALPAPLGMGNSNIFLRSVVAVGLTLTEICTFTSSNFWNIFQYEDRLKDLRVQEEYRLFLQQKVIDMSIISCAHCEMIKARCLLEAVYSLVEFCRARSSKI